MIDTTGGASKPAAADASKPKPGHSGKTSRCNHNSNQKCVNCMSAAIKKTGEEGKEGEEEESRGRCNHPSTSHCVNCMGKTASIGPTKPKCHHGPNQKCPNCMNEDEGMVADRKHEAFDGFISKMRKKCAKTHASN